MPARHIRSMDELERARGRWNDVYAHSGMKSPVLSYEYVKLWYECFSSPKDIRVFEVVEENKTIGFLPMVVRIKNGVRELTNQTNDHCLYGEALVRQGYEEVFKRMLLMEILNESGWDILRHIFGYSFSAMYPLFLDSFLAKRKRRWKVNIHPTYTIQLNKTFGEYFQNDLSTNMKKNLKRWTNKLERSGKHNYLHYKGVEAVSLWTELLRIEDSGWKGRNRTSILKTASEYRRYYTRFIQLLASTGDLHLYFLELNQKKIAAVFGFKSGDVFHYAKIGYDERFHALSPSNMLFIHLVKDLQEHHREFKRIHLFPYDDTGYKKRFANEDQQFAEIIVYNNTGKGQLRYVFDMLKEAIIKHPMIAEKIKKVLTINK